MILKFIEAFWKLFDLDDNKRILSKDILLCGRNGGKYNNAYYFYLATDEGEMIVDRHNLHVMDRYSHEIEAINYSGTAIGSVIYDNEPMDLVETMKGLKVEKRSKTQTNKKSTDADEKQLKRQLLSGNDDKELSKIQVHLPMGIRDLHIGKQQT